MIKTRRNLKVNRSTIGDTMYYSTGYMVLANVTHSIPKWEIFTFTDRDTAIMAELKIRSARR